MKNFRSCSGQTSVQLDNRWKMSMLAALCSLVMAASSHAQWTNPATGPVVIQDGFGDYGQNMPGFGDDYCQPTSAVMSILWLEQNGFSQLGVGGTFTSQNTPEVENLELLIAGLMNTSPTAGTDEDNGITGLKTYLDAAGLSGFYSYDHNEHPDITWFKNELAKNSDSNSITFVNYGVGWYVNSGDDNYIRESGHEMELLSASGTDLTGQITIHNPEPSALEDVQDIPQNSLQTVGILPVPSDWNLEYLSGTYVQLETSIVGGTNARQGAVDQAYAWTVSASALPASAGYVPGTWALDLETSHIDTNGATFTVAAPVTDGTDGPIGFTKTGAGTLLLTNSDQTTGTNVIREGTIASTQTGRAAFGTGSMDLGGDSGVSFQPGGSSGTVSLLLASGSGATLRVREGGGVISVNHGAYAGSQLVIGGNSDGITSNIEIDSHATLVLAVTSGSAGLGSTDQILVAGSAGNLPGNSSYGIVSAAIVGQNNDVAQSGFFLHYDSTAGFEGAQTETADINAAVDRIFDAALDQVVSNAGASVGALQVDNGISVSGGQLNIGSGAAGDDSGVILNGGSVSSALNFGASTGDIYASLSGGLISSDINGSAGLVTFGPGNLTLSGNNGSTLSGDVYVNSGTLTATGSASTGTGDVKITAAAALAVGAGATVTGNVDVKSDGTLILAGGTVSGNVMTDPTGTTTADTGGAIEGYGVISGAATITGQIRAGETMGTLEFTGSADLTGSLYYWNLASLISSDSGGTAGTDWNLLEFDGPATLTDMFIFLGFGSGVDDPNSDDAFWDTTHEWVFFEFSGTDWDDTGRNIQDTTFADGTFRTVDDKPDGLVYLEFDPVPEPTAFCLIATGTLIIFVMRRRPFARAFA